MAKTSFANPGAPADPLQQAAPAPGISQPVAAPAPAAPRAAAVSAPAPAPAAPRAAAAPAPAPATPRAAASTDTKAPRRRRAAASAAPAPQSVPAPSAPPAAPAAPPVAPVVPVIHRRAPVQEAEVVAPAQDIPDSQEVAEAAPPVQEVEVVAPAPAPLPPSLRPPVAAKLTPAVVDRGTLPAVPQNRNAFFDDQNIEFSDIQVPILNLVQKVGELADMFDPGEVVIDRSLPIPRPAKLVVLGLSAKRYVERVEGSEGQGGTLCHSLEEVAQSGGTILYREHEEKGIPWFQTLVTALCLVQRHDLITEEDSGIFPFSYDNDGSWYCLVRWNLKGTLYNQGAKVFMTARAIGRCRKGYPWAWWSLDTRIFKTRNGRSVISPDLRFVGETTPEFREFAQSCIGLARD